MIFKNRFQDMAAMTIRAHKGMNRRPYDQELADWLSEHRGEKIPRQYISAYLNRHIDLTPSDIVFLLEKMGLGEIIPKLSAPADTQLCGGSNGTG